MSNGEGGQGAGSAADYEALDSTVNFGATPTETHEVVEQPNVGLSPDVRAAIDALPQGTALLVVQRGPSVGARFLLDAESTTVGRDPGSNIFLDDVTVSRRHAEFVARGGSFAVRDFGSLNGTYVNRERADEVLLTSGDEVQIGKYRMTFHPSRTDTAGGTDTATLEQS